MASLRAYLDKHKSELAAPDQDSSGSSVNIVITAILGRLFLIDQSVIIDIADAEQQIPHTFGQSQQPIGGDPSAGSPQRDFARSHEIGAQCDLQST